MKRGTKQRKPQAVGRSAPTSCSAPKVEEPDYYALGIDAAHSGLYAAHCPYDFSTPEGEKWLQGYYDGGGND